MSSKWSILHKPHIRIWKTGSITRSFEDASFHHMDTNLPSWPRQILVFSGIASRFLFVQGMDPSRMHPQAKAFPEDKTSQQYS